MLNNPLAYTTPYPMGIEIVSADGIHLIDSNGKIYTDLISGIAVSNLGHNNHTINQAIKQQVDRHLHVMVYGEYKQSVQNKLASRLCNLLPDGLDVLYPVNSGTEANEAALKLVKRVTGRKEIISFNGAYHGSTHGSLSVTGNTQKKSAFYPLLPEVRFIDFNAINQLNTISTKTAGVIVEPIQGDAGVRIPSKEFLQALRDRCSEVGAMLIFDEIQTGFGRTGKLFAFEHYNVIPDILTIGKAFGGGMPIGGFISSNENMKSLTYNPKLGHITTFGGHPVCCAAALASLELISDKNLLSKVEIKGRLFEDLLTHPLIKEIRRKGMFFAIELENEDVVQQVVQGCKEKGVLTFWFLSNPQSFRIAPPLTITENEIKIACEVIIQVMDAI
ncbi:MAG: aspartate aminotransferase family protein [Crocinitomicaceae bacterium]|nr:aspartate aminotransferase family protein [Crocinitomicaceae bacterium]|tara:strand:- start:8259 stop:9425 length:1167 start_codon:yes stop_codon:yes gene_type:complete